PVSSCSGAGSVGRRLRINADQLSERGASAASHNGRGAVPSCAKSCAFSSRFRPLNPLGLLLLPRRRAARAGTSGVVLGRGGGSDQRHRARTYAQARRSLAELGFGGSFGLIGRLCQPGDPPRGCVAREATNSCALLRISVGLSSFEG